MGKIIALISNDGIYEDERYLSENSINELERHGEKKASDFWQCQPLRYKKDVYGQDEFYYHTGGAYGVNSLAGYNPNTKQGVVVLTSGAIAYEDDEGITRVCGEITNLLLNIGK